MRYKIYVKTKIVAEASNIKEAYILFNKYWSGNTKISDLKIYDDYNQIFLCGKRGN